MGDLPLAAIERLIRKGSKLRVGEDAKIIMQKELEEHAVKISAKAGQLAKHAKRKTVTKEDIELALKEKN